MLDVKELCKSFSKKQVLNKITFRVASGDVFGFIGRNGAGKSTTIKCILNFVFPDSGEILFKGRSTRGPRFRESIGYLPEIAQLPRNLTASEFLRYAASFYRKAGKPAEEDINSLLKDVGLEDVKKKLIKNFSKGMKQRLGIAQAVVHNPELLILDEPFTGLDPIGKYGLKQILLNLNRQGKTIFFSSHNLPEVQDICTVICIIHNGRVVYQGKTEDFITQFDAKDLEEAFIKSYRQSGGHDV
ncbi:MAG: ABC transporter ATP-binding protein [Candidatus Aureabacteria bacterium]|nr:ABC transporter ATP-binding protein [Candidatus Auribacterota bacterium]